MGFSDSLANFASMGVNPVDESYDGVLGRLDRNLKAENLQRAKERKLEQLTGNVSNYANMDDSYTKSGDAYYSNKNKIWNSLDPIAMQGVISDVANQQVLKREDGSLYQIDQDGNEEDFSGLTQRLYAYGTNNNPDEIKFGIAAGNFDSSDRRYIPGDDGYGWAPGEKGVDVNKNYMDLLLPADVAKRTEALLHGNTNAIKNRAYGDLVSDTSLSASKGKNKVSGRTEIYNSVEGVLGDATDLTNEELEAKMAEGTDTVNTIKREAIDKTDNDGMFGETLDIAQSSLIQQYGKTNKALRKGSRWLANKFGLDEDTINEYLPETKDIGTIGFDDERSTDLAKQDYADTKTGVKVETREDQAKAMKSAEENISKGNYLDAATDAASILPYILGDSTGEMAAIMVPGAGLPTAIAARVSEDAEKYEENNGKVPDSEWLMKSLMTNTVALATEKFLIKSGVSGALEKGVSKAGRTGKVAVSTAGEATQETFDQVQQEYMTQKEGDKTLEEIVNSDSTKLAALTGGIMGGTLSGTAQVGKATYEGVKELKTARDIANKADEIIDTIDSKEEFAAKARELDEALKDSTTLINDLKGSKRVIAETDSVTNIIAHLDADYGLTDIGIDSETDLDTAKKIALKAVNGLLVEAEKKDVTLDRLSRRFLKIAKETTLPTSASNEIKTNAEAENKLFEETFNGMDKDITDFGSVEDAATTTADLVIEANGINADSVVDSIVNTFTGRKRDTRTGSVKLMEARFNELSPVALRALQSLDTEAQDAAITKIRSSLGPKAPSANIIKDALNDRMSLNFGTGFGQMNKAKVDTNADTKTNTNINTKATVNTSKGFGKVDTNNVQDADIDATPTQFEGIDINPDTFNTNTPNNASVDNGNTANVETNSPKTKVMNKPGVTKKVDNVAFAAKEGGSNVFTSLFNKENAKKAASAIKNKLLEMGNTRATNQVRLLNDNVESKLHTLVEGKPGLVKKTSVEGIEIGFPQLINAANSIANAAATENDLHKKYKLSNAEAKATKVNGIQSTGLEGLYAALGREAVATTGEIFAGDDATTRASYIKVGKEIVRILEENGIVATDKGMAVNPNLMNTKGEKVKAGKTRIADRVRLTEDFAERLEGAKDQLNQVLKLINPQEIKVPNTEAQSVDKTKSDVEFSDPKLFDKISKEILEKVQKGGFKLNPMIVGILKEAKTVMDNSDLDTFEALRSVTGLSTQGIYRVFGFDKTKDSMADAFDDSLRGQEISKVEPLKDLIQNIDELTGEEALVHFTMFLARNNRTHVYESILNYQSDKNMARWVLEGSTEHTFSSDESIEGVDGINNAKDLFINAVSSKDGLNVDPRFVTGEAKLEWLEDALAELDIDQSFGDKVKGIDSILNKARRTGKDVPGRFWEAITLLNAVKDIREAGDGEIKSNWLMEVDATASGSLIKFLLSAGNKATNELLENMKNKKMDSYNIGMNAIYNIIKNPAKGEAAKGDAKRLELALTLMNKKVTDIKSLRDLLKMAIMTYNYGQSKKNNQLQFGEEVAATILADNKADLGAIVTKIKDSGVLDNGDFDTGFEAITDIIGDAKMMKDLDKDAQIELNEKLAAFIGDVSGSVLVDKVLEKEYTNKHYREYNNQVSTLYGILETVAKSDADMSIDGPLDANVLFGEESKGSSNIRLTKLKETLVDMGEELGNAIINKEQNNEISAQVVPIHAIDSATLLKSLYEFYKDSNVKPEELSVQMIHDAIRTNPVDAIRFAKIYEKNMIDVAKSYDPRKALMDKIIELDPKATETYGKLFEKVNESINTKVESLNGIFADGATIKNSFVPNLAAKVDPEAAKSIADNTVEPTIEEAVAMFRNAQENKKVYPTPFDTVENENIVKDSLEDKVLECREK